MNVPNAICETPKDKVFRLKGARYCFLYNSHLPKEAYYNWYKNHVITRRMEFELFVGHIVLNNAQFTRVLFRSISQTVDWKSKEKLFFKVGDTVFQPEIRPVYKTSWSTELADLYQLDPATYPPLNGPVTLQARSPKRIKGVSMQVLTPAPTAITSAVPAITSVPIQLTESVSVTPSAVPAITSAVPAITSAVPALPEDILSEKIANIINKMGILEKLNNIESILNHTTITSAVPAIPANTSAVPAIPANTSAVPAIQTVSALPAIPELKSKESLPQIIGIYIEGDAADLTGIANTAEYNFILENKSVITFGPITPDKNPVFKTRLTVAQIIDILIKYNIWYQKIIESNAYILKNTDMMILQAII